MAHIDPSIFKANDIRGVVGRGLDENAVRRVGRALAAAALKQGATKIALGRDSRLSGPSLAAAAAEGLAGCGIEVVDVGLAPTPAVYFAAHEKAGGCGVVITGSHNPKEYNGMKMMLGGRTLAGEQVRALREAAEEDGGREAGGGRVREVDISAEYVAAAAKSAGRPKRAMKIVVDGGNGAAGELAARTYEAMGCAVERLFCAPDGNFPNHHPDPAQPKNLAAAEKKMRETGADAAFVFDGDGDRLGAVFADAGAVAADRLLMLFAADMLARQRGAGVVFDVKCTMHLAAWIEKHGGQPLLCPTGHAFIKEKMRETGARLGGEMSGHFYFTENWRGFDDAVFAGARLAVIRADNESAAAMLAALPPSCASPELQAEMGGDRRALVEAFAELYARSFPARRLVRVDGARAEYGANAGGGESGFGLVRASNTTPCLIFRFESESELGMEKIKSDFRAVLAELNENLSLPF